jgi:hypothetical protein
LTLKSTGFFIAMWFALLILVIGIANLLVGFASASFLGWGPRNWDEVQLALGSDATEAPATDEGRLFQSELDLQRLIDNGQQKLRKLASTKTVLEDPLQSTYIDATSQLERLEIRLDCLHARILADELTDAQRDWQIIIESTRSDLSEDIERTMSQLEQWSKLLNEKQRETLNPFHFALCDELARIQDAMPAIASQGELDDADRVALCLWSQSSLTELHQISWQIRSLMRELLAQSRPALEWDPQMLRDRSHGMQSIEAFCADRLLNPTGEANYYVARCRIDQVLELAPRTGQLLFRVAGERLLEKVNSHIPSHWLVVPLPQGEWLIRGDAQSLDEFVVKMDEIRQRLASTQFRVGDSTFHFTSTWVITLDSSKFATEDLRLALRQAVHEAHRYGSDRTFVCEDGHPVPVLAVDCEIPVVIAEA